MKRHLMLALLATAFATGTLVAADESKYAKDFARFDGLPKPADGGIELIGSSTFTKWGGNAAKALAPLPVFNRAFGGSVTADVLAAAPQYVIPYKPRVVVYYCGDNDIGAKKTPEATAKGFTDFVTLVRKDLPQVRFVYLSIKPSPSRWALWSQAQKANDLVKAACTPTSGITYADIVPAVLGADGQPKAELFGDDKLHFNDAGNAVLAATLKPVVEKVWAEAGGK